MFRYCDSRSNWKLQRSNFPTPLYFLCLLYKNMNLHEHSQHNQVNKYFQRCWYQKIAIWLKNLQWYNDIIANSRPTDRSTSIFGHGNLPFHKTFTSLLKPSNTSVMRHSISVTLVTNYYKHHFFIYLSHLVQQSRKISHKYQPPIESRTNERYVSTGRYATSDRFTKIAGVLLPFKQENCLAFFFIIRFLSGLLIQRRTACKTPILTNVYTLLEFTGLSSQRPNYMSLYTQDDQIAHVTFTRN